MSPGRAGTGHAVHRFDAGRLTLIVVGRVCSSAVVLWAMLCRAVSAHRTWAAALHRSRHSLSTPYRRAPS